MRNVRALQFAGAFAGCLLSFNGVAFGQSIAVARVSAELVTSKLDSKSAKVGDAVVAKISSAVKMPDGTAVPKGSKLMGTVTGVHPYAKGEGDATLALIFDSIQTTRGQRIHIRAVLDSVSALVAHIAGADTPGELSAGEPISGVGNTPAANSGTMGAAAPSGGVSGTVWDGAYKKDTPPTPISDVGRPTNMPGISLVSPPTGVPSGVLHGDGKNVHIESGTLLTLRAASQP